MKKLFIDLILKKYELSKEIDVLNKDKAGLIKRDLEKENDNREWNKFLDEKVNLNAASIKDILFQQE